MSAPTLDAATAACTVRHRTPDAAARCGKPHPTDETATALPAPLEVTAADLRDVVGMWGGYGRLARFTVAGTTLLAVLSYPRGGETIVDAADVRGMVAHFGSFTAAAEHLTDALRWEVEHA